MTTPTPPPSSSGSDWPAQATDAVVSVVDLVKEKTNGPATSVARGLVYGTLFAILGSALLVLALIALHRGIDILVQIALDAADLEKPGRSNWITHLIMGTSFFVTGRLLLRRGSRLAHSA